MKNRETLEEAAERLYPIILEDDGWDKNEQYRDEWIEGAKWQQERSYSEEDLRTAYSRGWTTRERFDDLVPEILYPAGLDYEEKQEFAFQEWFEKFKK